MNGYLWLKAIHIIGVVCWFAGIFYLPRLFVYHSTTTDKPGLERFKIMEEKLYRMIMRPAMIVSVVFGVWLVVESWESYATSLWLWSKVFLVVLLLGYHHYLGSLIKSFANDNSAHTEKFFRLFNEIPVLLLILIVILVVVKPF